MLPEALAALAAAGGTALVEAATTDAWETAKHGMIRLFARSPGEPAGAVEARLERTRESLTAGDADQRGRQRADWTVRLEDLLQETPAAEGELRDLLTTLRPTQVNIVQHGDARDGAQQAIQGHGVQTNSFGGQTRR